MSLELDHIAACLGVAGLPRSEYVLSIKQEPSDCKALAKQEKARGAKWPLDPPPVVELTVGGPNNPNNAWMSSPFWFCNVGVDIVQQEEPRSSTKGLLIGNTVSSLHRVKHSEMGPAREKGLFIFGDLNIRDPGTYRLKFSLFEMRQGPDGLFAEHLGNTVHTKQFEVHSPKTGLPLRESTQLSRALCEAGVKLRIRKEQTNKRRKSTHQDWATSPHAYHGAHYPGMHVGPPFPSQPIFHTQRNGEDISNRVRYSNNGLMQQRDSMGATGAVNNGGEMSSNNQYIPQSSSGWSSGFQTSPHGGFDFNAMMTGQTTSGSSSNQYATTSAAPEQIFYFSGNMGTGVGRPATYANPYNQNGQPFNGGLESYGTGFDQQQGRQYMFQGQGPANMTGLNHFSTCP